MNNYNKKRRGCLAAVISFFLSIVLIAVLLIAIPVTLLHTLLTDQNIEIIVDHVFDSLEIDKIEFETDKGTKNISGIIYDATCEIEELDGITKEHINAVLNNGTIKDHAADMLKEYSFALKKGHEPSGWRPDSIYMYLQENQENIEELARASGYDGKIPIDGYKEEIISSLESAIGTKGLTLENILEDSNENAELLTALKSAQLIFSDNAFYLVWGSVGFIMILLLLVNWGFFGSFCRAGGMPAFFTGGLYFLLGLATTPALSLIEIPKPIFAIAIDFTTGFIGALLMDISITVLGIGFALIIISFIADAYKRKANN
jgi:hypothetical protein